MPQRYEPWTPADVARLREEMAARRPDWADLARALGRSERACREKARRLGLATSAYAADGYTALELARLLGVATGSVSYWRAQGLLVAPSARTGRYSRRSVRAFLVKHPELIGERVDRRWLVELLAGGGRGRAA